MIIRYVLNSDGTVPNYVADGGYFMLPDDGTEEKIGKAVPSGIPSDAPATTASISKSDLIVRVQGVIDIRPEMPEGAPDITVETGTATEIVDAWCIQVGEV